MDAITMLILVLVTFGIGYIVGWIGHAKGMLSRLLEDPDSMIKILDEYKKNKPTKVQTDSLVREVDVEQVNGVFFLYAKDNGQFLAQAASLDEALKVIEQRFPGQEFQGAISSAEAKRMGLSK